VQVVDYLNIFCCYNGILKSILVIWRGNVLTTRVDLISWCRYRRVLWVSSRLGSTTESLGLYLGVTDSLQRCVG